MSPKGKEITCSYLSTLAPSPGFSLAADLSMEMALLGADILPMLSQALRGPQSTIMK